MLIWAIYILWELINFIYLFKFTGIKFGIRSTHLFIIVVLLILELELLKNIYIYLFIFILACTGFSLLCRVSLQLQWAGATLHCGVQASYCSGFSCCRAQALGVWASVVAACGLGSWSCGSQSLECGLSSCGMWDVPGADTEPVSPALKGKFLSAVPPRTSDSSLKCMWRSVAVSQFLFLIIITCILFSVSWSVSPPFSLGLCWFYCWVCSYFLYCYFFVVCTFPILIFYYLLH